MDSNFMELLNNLKDYPHYFGIALLILLLIIFEIKYKQTGNSSSTKAYIYYTPNNNTVKICHKFGSIYKIYVKRNSPIPTKHDRFGNYFILKAHSVPDLELQIDELYETP